MDDFSNVFLTTKEKLILFLMRFIKRMPQKYIGESYDSLRKYGFILINFSPNRSPSGARIADGTFRLSDSYTRYRIYSRNQRIHRYLTPIVISVITTIATNLLKEMWLPVLLDWLMGSL